MDFNWSSFCFISHELSQLHLAMLQIRQWSTWETWTCRRTAPQFHTDVGVALLPDNMCVLDKRSHKSNNWGTLLWNLLWHGSLELSHMEQLQAITLQHVSCLQEEVAFDPKLFPTAWRTALCRWKSLHIFIYFIQPQSYSIANTLSRGKWRWKGAPSWLNMLKLLAELWICGRSCIRQFYSIWSTEYTECTYHVLSWTGEEPMILISFCLFRSQNVAGTGKLYETLAKHTVWSKLVCVSLDHPLGIWQCLDICLNGFHVTTCLTSSPAWGDPNSYGTEAPNFSILASRVIQTAPL